MIVGASAESPGCAVSGPSPPLLLVPTLHLIVRRRRPEGRGSRDLFNVTARCV